MEYRLSAIGLAGKLPSFLKRVRSNPEHAPGSLREALAAWRDAGGPDPHFADALDRVAEADHSSGTRGNQ